MLGRTGRGRSGAALLLVAAPARADEEVTARADDAAPAVSADAGFGAGVVGGSPLTAVDAGAGLAWDTGALDVGARLRVVGDRFVTADWDEVGDWLALIRRFAWHGVETRLDGAEGWRGELAVGPLGDARVGTGTLVDGYGGGVLADRRASGAHGRLARGATSVEALTGDLGRATLFAGGGAAAVGPLIVGGTVAIDPAAPRHADAMAAAPDASAPLAAVSASATWGAATPRTRGTISLDAGWEPGLGVGAALVGHGTARLSPRVTGRLRVEVGAGTAAWIPAPFGPLYLREREVAGAADAMGVAPTLVDRARAGELAGVGGAAAVALDVDDLGTGAVAVRVRPGLGPMLSARLQLPAFANAQGAVTTAWAPAERAFVLGAEARADLAHDLWTALEAARQYQGDDTPGLYAQRAVWQVTAWFGVAR
ncbi:MAG: hypothetical protein H6708_16975 [Kofleriaceae bacterium]|nr:hypothetical protein [Kofleriaceae bacterium]